MAKISYNDIVRVNGEIKTVKVRTKNYAEVCQRVTAFRKLYPDGRIDTILIKDEGGECIFQAKIYDDEGKMIGSGSAKEKEGSSMINKTSYLENCETSAVGRALGFCGIGNDTSIASYDEVVNAEEQQENFKKELRKITDAQIMSITNLCIDVGEDVPENLNNFSERKADLAIQRLMELRSSK